MIFSLKVPAAVAGVEEIRILEWHRKPGDAIKEGDLIVEMETHKAIVEVRAGQSGVLRQILAQEGDWRAIGLPVAICSSEPDEELASDPAGSSEMSVVFEVT